MNNFFRQFKQLMYLKPDTDFSGTSELIRANVEFRSANAWTLVFAMVIASVGLNVNSTAVIIGAMLISPLMGPIVGIGYALGVYDFELFKKSVKNLAVAILISLVASMLYFLLSPLSEVQSELLARTRPSFFDVLIAFFGGAAGIVALSRKEKGNAIPGVAIATALMPPLCTAGFGLATLNMGYFIGAMYLFVINSVFISISTFVFVRYLDFPEVSHVDVKQQKVINKRVAFVATAVLIPSFFTAWYLQRESFFILQANKYIEREMPASQYLIANKLITYSFKKPQVKVTILGEKLESSEIEALKQKAAQYSISPQDVEILQYSFAEKIEQKIKQGILTDAELDQHKQIQAAKAERELNRIKSLKNLSADITTEMQIFFSKLKSVDISYAPSVSPLDDSLLGPLGKMVSIHWSQAPASSDIKKINLYLEKRLNINSQQIEHHSKLKTSL
jgi:uncharacterized hydrophobic protein (TIGR00271 family)